MPKFDEFFTFLFWEMARTKWPPTLGSAQQGRSSRREVTVWKAEVCQRLWGEGGRKFDLSVHESTTGP